MSFLKNIFGGKDEPITSYADFWKWFQQHESVFFQAVKIRSNIEEDFFDILAPKLGELKEGFYFLAGMQDAETAELVLTPDGNISNIVFVEELIAAAPSLPNWKFTALKASMDIDNLVINMAGYEFENENLFFYSNEDENFPDEIDITIVHNDCDETNKDVISNGTYIFLDNYLGELDFAINIDSIDIIGPADATKELVPLKKLKDFLKWRQKEFVEKYEGKRYDIEDDSYSALEAKLKSGKPLIATINSSLLNWDSKASHPWILTVSIAFEGDEESGLPDQEMYDQLNVMEDGLLVDLQAKDGYLYIGRQLADGKREIYLACSEFRKPSKVMHDFQKKYGDKFETYFEIYKDKYWKSFERFRTK